MEEHLRLFSQYESEYCNKSTKITRKIEELSTLVGDQRRRNVRELDFNVRDATRTVAKMEMEVRRSALGQAPNYQAKIQDYKRNLQDLKGRLQVASGRRLYEKINKRDLGMGSEYSYTTSQRGNILRATLQANRSTELLRHCQQQLIEIKESGEKTLDDLSRQREQIVTITEVVHETEEELNTALKILSRMRQTIGFKKFGAKAIILATIVLLLYASLKKKKQH